MHPTVGLGLLSLMGPHSGCGLPCQASHLIQGPLYDRVSEATCFETSEKMGTQNSERKAGDGARHRRRLLGKVFSV